MIAAIGERSTAAASRSTPSTASTPRSWHRGDLSLEERAQQHARYEDWILNQVAPFIHGDAGAEHGDHGDRASASAPTTRRTSRSSAPTSSRSRSATAASTTSRSSAAAIAATRSTSTTPPTTSPPRRRPPRLAARPRQPPARLRAGPVGGHDGRAREHEALRRPARARRESGTSSTSGATTSRTTGPRGARRSLIICPGSSDGAHPPDRPPARHRRGLAGGVRAPARQGRPDRVRRRDARARRRADHERALRPALPAPLPARDRPARLVVHGAARVAEEGLADGRRLPAEQPVHVPGDGEALGVLRDDAARPEGARDVADPAQEPAGERALPARPRSATTCRSTSSRSPRRSAFRST